MVDLNTTLEVMNASFDATFPMASDLVQGMQGLTTKLQVMTVIFSVLYLVYVAFILMRWWEMRKVKLIVKDMQNDIKDLKKGLIKKKARKKK